MTAPRSPRYEVIVVGAGFGGIGAAVELKRQGIEDFVILEQAGEVGGAWRENTYPNVAVDIPSFSYQFSYAMNPGWSRVFAPGAEVKAYAEHLVDRFGLRPHLRLNTAVSDLAFDEDAHVWRVRLAKGEMQARFVIGAMGPLARAKLPEIEGLDDFERTMLHTSRWDHQLDLAGKRVGVIGTGATAVQLVPWIADRAKRQYVFQRTPIWVLPKPDAPIPAPLRTAFKYMPFVQDSIRLGASAAVEAGMVVGIMYNRQLPFIVRGVEQLGKAWLRSQVPDPVLRAKLTPDYGFGCKRPSMSNDYLRTFTRADTDLVSDPIERITPTGIRTTDGVERELDVLVLATGFLVSEPENMPAVPTFGRGGVNLREFWAQRRFQAYEGTSVPGFPNHFSIFGPYAATGSSWMFMIEYQAHHAVRVIREASRRGATCAEIRQEPHDRYFEQVQARMANTLFFNNGCGTANSYYFDAHGDAPFLRPATALETWWRSRRSDLDDYHYTTPSDAPATGGSEWARQRAS